MANSILGWLGKGYSRVARDRGILGWLGIGVL